MQLEKDGVSGVSRANQRGHDAFTYKVYQNVFLLYIHVFEYYMYVGFLYEIKYSPPNVCNIL